MNFERGNSDIKKTLDIGLSNLPNHGKPFLVRFRLRKSTPEYYDLQKLEEQGRSVIAIAIGEISLLTYDPITFNPYRFIHCYLKDFSDKLDYNLFTANYNYKEGFWEITDKID